MCNCPITGCDETWPWWVSVDVATIPIGEASTRERQTAAPPLRCSYDSLLTSSWRQVARYNVWLLNAKRERCGL